jgi:membrane associated rhomboid family serine protease
MASGPAAATPVPSVATALQWTHDAVGLQALAQLVTAAWTHGSALHLAANLCGTAVVALLGLAVLRERRRARRAACAWLCAWPLTQAGLWLEDGLARFAGASGVLHAGVAVLAVALLMDGRDRHRTQAAPSASRGAFQASALGALLLGGLLLKVVGEAPWALAVVHRPGWDVALAPLAHATGLVAGATMALAWLGRRRG